MPWQTFVRLRKFVFHEIMSAAMIIQRSLGQFGTRARAPIEQDCRRTVEATVPPYQEWV